MTDGKLLSRATPEKPMGFGGNFRGRSAARADGPDRLVCNQNTGELLRGQRAGAAVELAAENFFGQAGVAFVLSFSQEDDGGEAALQGHQSFFGDVVVGFAKKLAPLGMADDDVAAAGFGKHGGGNFAGECTFLAPGDVLTGDGDAGAFGAFERGGDRCERRGDNNVAVLRAGNEWKERGEKRASVRERLVHFPVASDYAASHGDLQRRQR